MTTITLRLDDSLKANFAETCDKLGLDMTTACYIFIKKMTREQRIPFEVAIDPFYSERNIKHLESVVKNIESGKAVLSEHSLIEVE